MARKQLVPQVLEKARFAEKERIGSRSVGVFFKLQKSEVKRLKSLSRAQNLHPPWLLIVSGTELGSCTFHGLWSLSPIGARGTARRRQDERATKITANQAAVEA